MSDSHHSQRRGSNRRDNHRSNNRGRGRGRGRGGNGGGSGNVGSGRRYHNELIDTHCHVEYVMERLASSHSPTSFSEVEQMILSLAPNTRGVISVFCDPVCVHQRQCTKEAMAATDGMEWTGGLLVVWSVARPPGPPRYLYLCYLYLCYLYLCYLYLCYRCLCYLYLCSRYLCYLYLCSRCLCSRYLCYRCLCFLYLCSRCASSFCIEMLKHNHREQRRDNERGASGGVGGVWGAPALGGVLQRSAAASRSRSAAAPARSGVGRMRPGLSLQPLAPTCPDLRCVVLLALVVSSASAPTDARLWQSLSSKFMQRSRSESQ
jgi:hypothetical protein